MLSDGNFRRLTGRQCDNPAQMTLKNSKLTDTAANLHLGILVIDATLQILGRELHFEASHIRFPQPYQSFAYEPLWHSSR